ncbi:MAG: MATE family efflux transporter [Parvularculaceae bacterium]
MTGPAPAAPDPSTPYRKRGPRLTNRPVGVTLWTLAWPTTIGLFSVLAFNIIDTLYIGRLGAIELAAIGFCFPVILTLGSVAFGLSAGATAVMSQTIGAGDEAGLRRTATNALVLIIAVTLGFAALGLATIDPLFTLLGAEPGVIAHIRRYMTVYYAGLPVVLSPIILQGFMRATGETLIPSAVMVAGAATNAMVSPLLIFGLLGFPRLEIAGAAWGTLAARSTMTAAAFLLVHFREHLFDFRVSVLKAFWPSVKGVLAIGVPAVATQVITPLSSAVLTRLLSGWGQDVVAAFAVGARLEALFLIPFWALQGGVAPFVGQNYGAGRHDRLKETERWIWRFALGWGATALVAALLIGRIMTGFFTRDPAIAAMSAHYFAYATAGFFGAGLMLASASVFNSLSRPTIATGVVALRFIGFYIPLGIVFSRMNGPEGVFAATSISYLAAGIVGAFMVRRTLARLPAYSALNKTAT